MPKRPADAEYPDDEEEVVVPPPAVATYDDVPKAEMDLWATKIEGFPCAVVSDVFLRWIKESRWTGFIPPPPPCPTPEQLAGPPKVELTAKGLPSFRCRHILTKYTCFCVPCERADSTFEEKGADESRMDEEEWLELGDEEEPYGVWVERCLSGSALDV